MTNLRNPFLRARDLQRLIEPKLHAVVWEGGIEKNNEWVYASLDSDAHRTLLREWLRSKDVEFKQEALCIMQSDWRSMKWICWADLIDRPADFFLGTPFKVISSDLDWALDYLKEGVARFGRWHGRVL